MTLVSGQIYILFFKIDLKKYFYAKLVVPIVLAEGCLVYFGQYCHRLVETKYIRLIIGVLVMVVALIRLALNYFSRKRSEQTDIENDPEAVPNYPNITLYATLTGCITGFSGGLIGMKGPPLIIFFLIFPFPKTIIRATGVLASLVNVIVRIIVYCSTVPPELDWPKPSDRWFIGEDWPIYVALLVASVVGCVFGDRLFSKVSQGKFDFILTVLLFVCGGSMLLKSVLELM